MKKILFILIPMCAFSQEKVLTTSGKSVILNSDYTWKYDDSKNLGLKAEDFKTTKDHVSAGLLSKVIIPVKNGEDQYVDVKFHFISNAAEFSKISLEKIQKMIDISSAYVVLNLKNKYSFIPRKVDVTYIDPNKNWSVMWEYTAKNSYGGETEGTKMVLFDNDINRVDL